MLIYIQTGASLGIGKQIVLALAEKGVNLILFSRTEVSYPFVRSTKDEAYTKPVQARRTLRGNKCQISQHQSSLRTGGYSGLRKRQGKSRECNRQAGQY